MPTSTIPAPPPIARTPMTLGRVEVGPRFFLAPLAGYTGLAFRLMVRGQGGLGLATTDLVNSRSIIEERARSFELTETCAEDSPLAIQLYGSEAAEMAEAARRVVDRGAAVVDINMGCPVRKVVKTGGGSALMCDADSASRLVGAVVGAVDVPVTVKMRLGWDAQTPTAPQLARLFERLGVAAVIVHGRTRAQGFKGGVDLSGIRDVVEAVDRMPIVGNGDVRTLADAARMLEETGVSAISIGRGALSNPFFFRELERWSATGDPGPPATFEERVCAMERHFRALVDRRGERMACLQFRKLVKWYSYAIRPPKPLYHALINVPSVAVFDDALRQIRDHGPNSPLPGHFEPRVPVPTGPIDKW